MNSYDFQPRHLERTPTPWAVLGGMFMVVVLIGVALWGFGLFPFGNLAPAPHDPNVKERESAPRTARNTEEQERIRVHQEAKPSVVNVDTMAYAPGGAFNTEEYNLGTGSGFFWDKEGRIVTNFHVVRGALSLDDDGKPMINPARKIVVTLASGKSIPARLVGVEPSNDLAVIQLTKLPDDGVKPIAVGKSNDLEVGQTVYALGSPFGQQGTFTNGIISALGRSIQSPTQHLIMGAIQTNAAMNPGNSGGPLLDKDGRLIGVNTAITTPNGGNVGLGYSIPVDTVNKVVTELIRKGRVVQPYIGAEFYLNELRVRNAGIAEGVVVAAVRPQRPAAAAGLQPGDIILKINGEKTVGLADLQRLLNQVKVGDKLTCTVQRGDQELQIHIQVEGL